jgi:hypothetical protein
MSLPLTSFEKGRLKIAAHAREELERAAIAFESIQCKSGGTQIPRDIARLTVTANGTAEYVDLRADEVEECEAIVAGETWRKIAGLIDRLRK